MSEIRTDSTEIERLERALEAARATWQPVFDNMVSKLTKAEAELAALRQAHAALRAEVATAVAEWVKVADEEDDDEWGRERASSIRDVTDDIKAALAPRPERPAP